MLVRRSGIYSTVQYSMPLFRLYNKLLFINQLPPGLYEKVLNGGSSRSSSLSQVTQRRQWILPHGSYCYREKRMMKRCSRPARRWITICMAAQSREGDDATAGSDLALKTILFLHSMLNFWDVVLLEGYEVEAAVRREKILQIATQRKTNQFLQSVRK